MEQKTSFLLKNRRAKDGNGKPTGALDLATRTCSEQPDLPAFGAGCAHETSVL